MNENLDYFNTIPDKLSAIAKNNTFTKQSMSASISAAINPNNVSYTIEKIINSGLQNSRASQTPRNYLGASQIGEECLRKLQYILLQQKPSTVDPRAIRTFDIGHTLEDLMISWLLNAGFKVTTREKKDSQIGFSTADGKIAGHVDGIITYSPSELIKTPCILECKTMNQTNFANTIKSGVFIAKPTYYTQVQLYMFYLNIHNPTLFMSLNKNTSELYFEYIPFDEPFAINASNKAMKLISYNNLAPQISSDPTFFKCQMCEFRDTCFHNCFNRNSNNE